MIPEEIKAARERIKGYVIQTPCTYSERLSHLAGCELYLKLENLQVTGSFKDRGAFNKLLQLTPDERAAGVIAASAGNHAQGVAHAARLLGIDAVIVMPETAPLAKIQGTEEFEAQVILRGGGFDETLAVAQELAQEKGYTFIHAFNDPAIIAGQGTIGQEIAEQVPNVELVVVPVGGGGLIGGIALAIREARPEVRIVGVQTERIPSMLHSLHVGRPEALTAVSTLADGIAVAKVGTLTLPLAQRYVERIITVGEEEIAAAIMTLLEREKTLAEGGGVVGLSALLRGKIPDVQGQTVVVVVSGGNLDMTMLARIVERGLETDGRLARVKVVIPDKPGCIADLARSVADQGANIFDISQTRSITEVKLGEMEVELVLETRGRDHVLKIAQALTSRGLDVR